MHVLYIASTPTSLAPMDLTAEVNELQGVAAKARGVPVTFTFRPLIRTTELADFLASDRPDVLHMSVHGSPTDGLQLADAAGGTVPVSAAMLAAAFRSHLPEVVFLNACDSNPIATELRRDVNYVVGADLAITDKYAVRASQAFYSALIEGHTVEEAFKAYKASSSTPKVMLKGRSVAKDAARGTSLYRPPTLVARFHEDDPKGHIVIGLQGVPAGGLVQVVFFTTDHKLATDAVEADNELEDALCEVQRVTVSADAPLRSGTVWTEEDTWNPYGDLAMFAALGEFGKPRIISSWLSEALTKWYDQQPLEGKLDDKRMRRIRREGIAALKNEKRGRR